MGRTRASIAVIFVGGLIAAPAIEGCGGGSPPDQSGTQLLAGRDFGNLFFWNANTAAFTRQASAPGAGGQDLWVWPDGENAPLLALPQIDWSPPITSAELIVGDILVTGFSGERVYDLQARTAINLQTIADGGMTVTNPIDWMSVRRDGGSIIAHSGTGELLAGRDSTFTFLPSPYFAWQADFMGNDLAVLASASISSDDLKAELLYRMALPSGELSPLPVPPLTPTGASCASFGIPPCPVFRVVGCGADDAVCPETGRAPCAILYLRADATTMVAKPYMFDVNTGQETLLPGNDPSAFMLSPDRQSVAWLHSDYDDMSNGAEPPAETPIYVHNFCTGAAVQCSLPRPRQLEWRRDGGELVVDLAGNQLGLFDVPTATCTALDVALTGSIEYHVYSPAGDRLAWVAADPAVDGSALTLRVRDSAGGEPRTVASGVETFRFSPDGQALFITHGDTLQLSLTWLSLATDSSAETPIASPYSGAVLRGNQRAVLIDRWNSQDESGDLELVDIPSGTHHLLAHAVTGLAASGSIDGAARVLYTVRGRFASGQDGLWQTTLATQ